MRLKHLYDVDTLKELETDAPEFKSYNADHALLRLDIREAIVSLPPKVQKTAIIFLDGELNLTDIAKRLDMNRTTLHRHKKIIENHFIQFGLLGYL